MALLVLLSWFIKPTLQLELNVFFSDLWRSWASATENQSCGVQKCLWGRLSVKACWSWSPRMDMLTWGLPGAAPGDSTWSQGSHQDLHFNKDQSDGWASPAVDSGPETPPLWFSRCRCPEAPGPDVMRTRCAQTGSHPGQRPTVESCLSATEAGIWRSCWHHPSVCFPQGRPWPISGVRKHKDQELTFPQNLRVDKVLYGL